MTLLAASEAFSKSFGLLFTFVFLIGGVVNAIVVYIAIQVRGERQQNEEYRQLRAERLGGGN